ncbi:MAG: ion transporter, partial [archaeon]|nr:ion transporter [archaeon]
MNNVNTDNEDLDADGRRLEEDQVVKEGEERVVEDDEDTEFRYEWVAVLINDAIHTRSRSVASLPPTSRERYIFRWFRISHNPWFRRFIFLVIFALLLVGFFESPARGIAGPLPLGASNLIEYLCLVIIVADTLTKIMWMRPRSFFKDKWNLGKVVVLSVYFLDLFVGYCFLAFNVEAFRVSRFLRVYFLLEKSRRLRAMVQNVGKTFVSIFSLLCFIGVVVICWAFLGYYLFYNTDEGAAYFRTFGQSFVSLFILVTTANFPDVMMPAYSEMGVASLYFVLFLLFVLYFLLNALTATVYNSYRTETRSDVNRGLRVREKALYAAFRELQDDGAIPFSTWQRVMLHVRSDLTPYYTGLIFNIVDQNCSGRLELDNFMNICDFIDLSFSKDRSKYCWDFERGRFQRFCHSLSLFKPYHLFCSLMLLANAALAIAESYECNLDLCSPYGYVEWGFLGYFWIDFGIRLIGSGMWQFWISPWNIFDFLTLFGWTAGFIAELSLNNSVPGLRYVLVLQTLRLLRLLSTTNEFQMITNTFVDLLPHMVYYLALLFCIFYDFALLGEELFYGRLNPPNPILSHMTYGQSNYWANNFNSMSSAFVTLFELMVVNNWFLIMDAVVAVTSYWSRLYFMSFFIV